MLRKVKDWVTTSGKIETVLGPNTSVNGHLKADGNLRIEGLYDGVIEIAGNLIIGENAKVRAEIKAHAVQVWGIVNGHINASDRLEILSTGQVFADVVVKSLLTDDGGVFRGQCVIRGAESAALASPAEDTSPSVSG